MTYPILEHDPTPEAKIESSKFIAPRDMPEHSVACFFKDVIDKVVKERQASVLIQRISLFAKSGLLSKEEVLRPTLGWGVVSSLKPFVRLAKGANNGARRVLDQPGRQRSESL